LLDTMDTDSMVRYDEGTRDDGQSLIAFSAAEIETEERIDIAYYIGDDQVTEVEKGDIVRLSLYWGGYYQKNSLYMVYMKPDAGIKVLSTDGISEERGYILMIEADTGAELYFEALESGSHLASDIVLFNLTQGTVVGKCYGEGITVQ